MSNEIELKTNQVLVEKQHITKVNTFIKPQTIYPGQKVEGLKKPKDAQIWHKDWGETWESKAEYDAKQRLDQLEAAKKDLEIVKQKNLEIKEELLFTCNCGFKSKSDHGLKIHKGSCEYK